MLRREDEVFLDVIGEGRPFFGRLIWMVRRGPPVDAHWVERWNARSGVPHARDAINAVHDRRRSSASSRIRVTSSRHRHVHRERSCVLRASGEPFESLPWDMQLQENHHIASMTPSSGQAGLALPPYPLTSILPGCGSRLDPHPDGRWRPSFRARVWEGHWQGHDQVGTIPFEPWMLLDTNLDEEVTIDPSTSWGRFSSSAQP